jgi:hypothetical protein
VACDGQGAVGRACGDDFDAAEDGCQPVQDDVAHAGIHVVFVPG